jgi:predicted ribonuclease YlaK
MIERVRANETGIQNKRYKRYQSIEALTDPAVWLIVLMQACGTLVIGGTLKEMCAGVERFG